MGLLAGYFGGRIDMAVTFMVTTRLAMPVILVALAVVAIIGSSLWIVILVLGLLKWDRFAVVMRSATQQVRSLDLLSNGIVDRIVAEHPDAADEPVEFSHRMAQAIAHELTALTRMDQDDRLAARHDRYRSL